MNSSMLKVTSKDKLPCLVIRDTIAGELFPQGAITKDIIMYENPQEELDIINPPEITYNGSTKPNTKVEMLSETGEVLATATSNSEGRYSFKPSKPLIPNVTRIRYRYTYSDGTPQKTTPLEIGYKKDYSKISVVTGLLDVDITYTLKKSRYVAGDKISITLTNDPTIKKEYILTAEDITAGKATVSFPVYKATKNLIYSKIEHLTDNSMESLNTVLDLSTSKIKPKVYVQFKQGNQKLSDIWAGKRHFTLALKYKGEVLYFTYNVSHEAKNIESHITNRAPITYMQKLSDPSIPLKSGGIGFLLSDKCNALTLTDVLYDHYNDLAIGRVTGNTNYHTLDFIKLSMEKTLGNIVFRVKDTQTITLLNGTVKPFVGFTIDLPGFTGTVKDAENILKELEIEWTTSVNRQLYQEWYPLYINEACDNMLMHRANPLYAQNVTAEQFENLCSSRKIAEFRSYTYKKPYCPPYTSNNKQTDTMQLYPVLYDPMSQHPTTSFVIGWDNNAMNDSLFLSDTYLEDRNITTIYDKNGVLFLPYKCQSYNGVLDVKKCPLLTKGDTTRTNLMFIGSALAKDKEYKGTDALEPYGIVAGKSADRLHSYIMYHSTLDKYLAGGIEAFDTHKDFYVETDMTIHQEVDGVIPADKYNSLKVYFKDYLDVFTNKFKTRDEDQDVHKFYFRFATTRSRIYEIFNGTAQIYNSDIENTWKSSLSGYQRNSLQWFTDVTFTKENSVDKYPYTLKDMSNASPVLNSSRSKHNSLLFLTSMSRYLTAASENFWRGLRYPFPSKIVFTLSFKVEQKNKDGFNPEISNNVYDFIGKNITLKPKDDLYCALEFNKDKEGLVPTQKDRRKLWSRVDMYISKDPVGKVTIVMPRTKDDYGFTQGGQSIPLEIPYRVVLSVTDAPVAFYEGNNKTHYGDASAELVPEDTWMISYEQYRYIYPKEVYTDAATKPTNRSDWVTPTGPATISINSPTTPGRIPYVQVGLMFEFPYENLDRPVAYSDPQGMTTNYANYEELYNKAKEYIFNNIYIALSQFKLQID